MTTNPKDLLGIKKCDLSLLPPIAIYHASHAMNDGAFKYGPYNWRGNAVRALVYIAAASRHILRWACGETYTSDTGVHNLGCAMACLAILLDAEATGNLVDDRAKSEASLKGFDEIDARVKRLAESKKVDVPTPTASEPGTN